MFHETGIAYSYEDLRNSMLYFATRTLGSFRDLFDGNFGRSLYDVNNYEVLGLEHVDTGATYLFDFAPSKGNYVNVGGEFETTIIGQLLSRFTPTGVTDYSSIIFPDEASGQVIGTPGSGSLVVDVAISAGVITVTDTDAAADGGIPNWFLGTVVGSGLLIQDDSDPDIEHIIRVDAIDVTGSIITGTQVGSIHLEDPSSALITSNWASSRSFVRRTFFPVEVGTDPPLVEFGAMPESMWDSEVTIEEAREGYFPRSGRHKFDEGVHYSFYGNNDEGDDYFHMALGDGAFAPRTHWWMGRVTGSSPALLSKVSSAGMFLGTSGPHTDYATGVDTYQYLFEHGDAEQAWKNPCIMVAPMAESNFEFQYRDNAVYTGSAGYAHNFGPDDLDGWVEVSGVDVGSSAEGMTLITTSSDPHLHRPSLTVTAADNPVVRFAIKKTADGDATTQGQLFFQGNSSGTYTGHSVNWGEDELEYTLGSWWVYRVDMNAQHGPGNGSEDWDGTITALRMDTAQSGTVFGEEYVVSWIRIDDGDDTTNEGIQVFEQVAGGVNGYGPTGPSHLNTYGTVSENKDLNTSTYSIQAGLNSFQGPTSYGMDNTKGRTRHHLRPTDAFLLSAEQNYIHRFAPVHAILYETPSPAHVGARIGTPLADGNVLGENAQYLSEHSYFMYVGAFPGVFRVVGQGVALQRYIDIGPYQFDEISVAGRGDDGDLLELDPTDPCLAAYIYPR